mgnify:CR=1 FL=1
MHTRSSSRKRKNPKNDKSPEKPSKEALEASHKQPPAKMQRRVSNLDSHSPAEKKMDALHCEAVYQFYTTRDSDTGDHYILLFEHNPIRRSHGAIPKGCGRVGSDLLHIPTWMVPGGRTELYREIDLAFNDDYLRGEKSNRDISEHPSPPESESSVVIDTMMQLLSPLAVANLQSWFRSCNEVRRLKGRFTTKHGRQTIIKLESHGEEMRESVRDYVHLNMDTYLREKIQDGGDSKYIRCAWINVNDFLHALYVAATQVNTCLDNAPTTSPMETLVWVTDDVGRMMRIAIDAGLVLYIRDEFEEINPDFRDFLLSNFSF